MMLFFCGFYLNMGRLSPICLAVYFIEFMERKMTKKVEQFEFQAEVSQVLDLVIHSLYSNKEIFLRELISNASDACDKRRFESIKNKEMAAADDLFIQVDFDKEAKTVTISDNGIGMSRDEVIANIGTIANSGTKKFLQSIAEKDRDDANLIGQFGVGFYASFIVAESVELTTRKAGTAADQAVIWSSDGKNAFSLEATEKAEAGTQIVLHLRDEEVDFADDFRLRNLIKKYSEHVAFPIKMLEVTHPETDDDGNEIPAKTPEYEVVNDATALWKKSPSEIKDEDYQAFYKQISHDFNEAAFWSHNHIESGTQSYSNLLFVPEKSPFNMFQNPEEREGLKLYVKRVFIMDAAKELLPNYLRFVKGVVDSNDLPLNVSRELLQDNPLLQKIRSGLVKRVLGMLKKKTVDGEVYANFWEQFGDILKEGVVEDFANREAILKLLRFSSTENDDAAENVSLDDYLARCKDSQDKIYYLTGESYQALKNSPHLELFKKKGVEVLLMHNRIDEWIMSHVNEYDGKAFQSVAKGKIELGEEKDEPAETSDEDKSLLKQMQENLKQQVSEVTASNRLVDSASCLVMDENAMAIHMQKLMEQAGQAMPGQLPAMEVNLSHPLVKHIVTISDEERFAQWSELLYQQALLAEGGQLKNPAEYVHKLNQLMLEIMG